MRQNLDVNGSQEYALTWKRWDMESGPPICALRASGRRTSDSGCGGWHSPQAHDVTPRGKGQKIKHGTKHGCGDLNADVATMPLTLGMSETGTNPDGSERNRLDQLPRVAHQAFGQPLSGTTAGTEKQGAYRLNPLFSLWLMGYPIGWASCGALVTRLSRRLQRRS